jgi:hypothetical protein
VRSGIRIPPHLSCAQALVVQPVIKGVGRLLFWWQCHSPRSLACAAPFRRLRWPLGQLLEISWHDMRRARRLSGSQAVTHHRYAHARDHVNHPGGGRSCRITCELGRRSYLGHGWCGAAGPDRGGDRLPQVIRGGRPAGHAAGPPASAAWGPAGCERLAVQSSGGSAPRADPQRRSLRAAAGRLRDSRALGVGRRAPRNPPGRLPLSWTRATDGWLRSLAFHWFSPLRRPCAWQKAANWPSSQQRSSSVSIHCQPRPFRSSPWPPPLRPNGWPILPPVAA